MKKNIEYICLLLVVVFIVAHCLDDTVRPNNLLWYVAHPFEIHFFETRYLYFISHLLPVIPVFIACLHPKIAFYKQFKHALPALLLTAIPFLIWDYFKTVYHVWGFNPQYYTLSFCQLPIEEYLFFIHMPLGILLIHEGLNSYFPIVVPPSWEKSISWGLVILFWGIGLSHWGRAYTYNTFVLCAIALMYHLLRFDSSSRWSYYRTYSVGFIGFFLVNSILTGIASRQPVVVYNPEEYLGIRLGTIPVDDAAYNFLLLLSVVSLYDYFKFKKI